MELVIGIIVLLILCLGLAIALYKKNIKYKELLNLNAGSVPTQMDVKSDELDLFFTVSLDMFCIADTNGYFRVLNPEWERTLGYKLSELTEKRFIEFVHPDDVAETIRVTQELANKKAVVDFENRYRHKNGSYRWIEWRSYPINNMVYAAARDITLRKTADEALLKSEEKYRLLFENMTSGFALHQMIYDDNGTPADYKYIEANPAFGKLTGLATDKIIGKTIKEIIPDIEDYWIQTFGNVAITGKSVTYTNYAKDLGRYYDTFVFRPQKDMFAVMFNDVTERVNAEVALRESESKLRSFINESSEGIVIINESGIIEEWNTTAKSITGISGQEAQNQFWWDIAIKILPVEMQTDAVNKKMEKVIQTILKSGNVQVPAKTIYPIQQINGSLKHIEQTLFTIKTNAGYRMAIIFNDITERKKTEEELKQARTFTDALLAGIPGLVYMYNEDGLLVRWNKRHEIETGYSAEELSKMHLLDWYKGNESDIAAVNEGMKKVYSEGFGTAEAYLQKKNGEKVLYYFTAVSTNIDGKIYFTGIGIDITERKNVELALKKSESILKATMESMKDGILVVSSNGVISHKNSRFSQIFSIPDELLSTNNDEILINYVKQQLTNPDEFLKQIEEIYKSDSSTEDILHLNNGRIIERYSSPLTKDSLFGGRVWMFRDITDRQKAEELIAHERNMLRTLIDNIPDLVYVKDTESRFLLANMKLTQLLSLTFDDVLGKTDLELFPNELAADFYADERHLIATGEPVINKEEAITDKFGNEIILKTTKLPLRDVSGAIVGLVGTGHIITEQKKAENEIRKLNEELEKKVEERTLKLQELNKELESFAYSISHDLRAPLRHIDGFVRLMYSSIQQPADNINNYYQKITNASRRMSGMIDELLAFSRLGRKDLNFAPVDLAALVNEIIEQSKPDITERSLNWKIHALPVVSADRNLLKIAFENLISNAIKYTSKKPNAEIEIGSNPENNKQVIIYIKDNGAGFDMAYSEKLFGVFQRLHSPDEFEGIGIGLANVKQIIAKHNGFVCAEGKVNEGATFYITLPK